MRPSERGTTEGDDLAIQHPGEGTEGPQRSQRGTRGRKRSDVLRRFGGLALEGRLELGSSPACLRATCSLSAPACWCPLADPRDRRGRDPRADSAKVLKRLEKLLEEGDPPLRLVDSFDLIAGTSTGGLIALALSAPPPPGQAPLTAARLVEIYSGPEGRAIFERPAWRELPIVRRFVDLFEPRYSLKPLRDELRRQVGGATVADAATEILISAFDMRAQEPVFFKRWDKAVNATSMVNAGLATAAAPTYFPAHGALGGALIDGGVFVANPTVAAIIEAMKRTVDPVPSRPQRPPGRLPRDRALRAWLRARGGRALGRARLDPPEREEPARRRAAPHRRDARGTRRCRAPLGARAPEPQPGPGARACLREGRGSQLLPLRTRAAPTTSYGRRERGECRCARGVRRFAHRP